VIIDVKLRLSHLLLLRSADLDALLVSPSGARMIPISDAAGRELADDVDLVLTDAAETPLPSSAIIASGTYRPANYGATVDLFPGKRAAQALRL
jgi:hypothetical protein